MKILKGFNQGESQRLRHGTRLFGELLCSEHGTAQNPERESRHIRAHVKSRTVHIFFPAIKESNNLGMHFRDHAINVAFLKTWLKYISLATPLRTIRSENTLAKKGFEHLHGILWPMVVVSLRKHLVNKLRLKNHERLLRQI